MAYRTLVSFNESDFSGYTEGSISIPITEKQGALLSSALLLLIRRDAWQDMTDEEWDTLESYLSSLLEKVLP